MLHILKIIHGYPPLYNAGSEVYSQTLCHGLAKQYKVSVFTRKEDPFAQDFSISQECDHIDPAIDLYMVNIPLERHRYRYIHDEVSIKFKELLLTLKPDIVHIGHLNHLSISIVDQCYKENIPMLYTLHDYWLMCPRGQFIQRNGVLGEELWRLCYQQKDDDCAQYCYAGYFSGDKKDHAIDLTYWSAWINKRMQRVREMARKVNLFIAPSNYLYDRFAKSTVIPKNKLIYLDYGFDLNRFIKKQTTRSMFTFGYIGTHIPAKGIQLLIEAFGQLVGNAKLIIWGRSMSQNTQSLHELIKKLPAQKQKLIEWRSEYNNENITTDVFNHVNCIVVPSIWIENSPLVIHEALQARIPVITADVGGMAEYVTHEVNGLLFKHRNINSLHAQMQRFLKQPLLEKTLSKRGYMQSKNGNIVSVEEHVRAISAIYKKLLTR